MSQDTAWVGREADLKRMTQVFADNQESLGFRPTTIAIGGPCGIGKTRLALHFIKQSHFDLKVMVVVPPQCEDINKLLEPYLGFEGDSLNKHLRLYVQEELERRKVSSNNFVYNQIFYTLKSYHS